MLIDCYFYFRHFPPIASLSTNTPPLNTMISLLYTEHRRQEIQSVQATSLMVPIDMELWGDLGLEINNLWTKRYITVVWILQALVHNTSCLAVRLIRFPPQTIQYNLSLSLTIILRPWPLSWPCKYGFNSF